MVRDPSRTPRGRKGQCLTIQEDSCQELAIRSDAENLYSGNLYGGSTQGVSGNVLEVWPVTGESSSGGVVFQ